MKQEYYAILILIAFPILYIGGVFENVAAASIGVLLLLANALAITIQKKASKKAKAATKENK